MASSQSSVNHALISPEQSLQGCRLLSLPAELRNNIYELTFSTDGDASIDLLTARPPSIELILTCRQVYVEGASIYRHAYRKFWTESNFEINIKSDPRGMPTESNLLDALDERNVLHVKSLTVNWPNVRRGFQFTLSEGIWRHQYTGEQRRTREFLIEPQSDRHEILPRASRFSHSGRRGKRWQLRAFANASEAEMKRAREYAKLKLLTLDEVWWMVYHGSLGMYL